MEIPRETAQDIANLAQAELIESYLYLASRGARCVAFQLNTVEHLVMLGSAIGNGWHGAASFAANARVDQYRSEMPIAYFPLYEIS